MELEIIILALFVLLATLFPTAIYLTIRYRTRAAERRNRLGDLQMLWEKVYKLNQEVVDLAKKSGTELKQAPIERTYKEWAER